MAAGWGGSIPCTTERPATSEIPIFTSDIPVRRAIVNTSGTSRTNPTWKNTGMPTMKATNMIAQCTRRSPKRSMSVVAMRFAAPDSAMIFPSIVPSPTTMAMNPSTLPTPVWKDWTARPGGIPATRPIASETTTRAMNG